MSDDGVYPREMNAPHDFDDAAAEALVSGHGHGVDSGLADLVGDMRVAYTSPPALGAELSALIGVGLSPAPTSPSSRRFERMRSSVIARVGVATATLVAATGGLAVAHALPAPVQDAASHLGIGAPAHHNDQHIAGVEPTTVEPIAVDPTVATEPEETTVPGDTTPTTAEPTDNNGNAAAPGNHDANGDNNSCDAHNDAVDLQDGPDATDASTAPANPDPTMPCVPTTDTTTPQSSGSHDSHGDSQLNKGDDTTAATTVPNGDGHDNNTSAATVPNGDSNSSGGGDRGSGSGGGN